MKESSEAYGKKCRISGKQDEMLIRYQKMVDKLHHNHKNDEDTRCHIQIRDDRFYI